MSDLSKEQKNILQHLKAGKWEQIEHIAFALDGDSSVVSFRDDVLKIIRFWQKRTEFLVYEDQSTGKKLFAEWEHFIDFCREYEIQNVLAFFAIKSFVLKKTIDFLLRASKEFDNSNREVLVLLAYAFYEAEMIDKAADTLEYILARFLDEDDARVYTLLGDIYGTNDNKKDLAVIMFNELFLKCIDHVDIESIDYKDIQTLVDGIKNDLFADNHVKYWIPIYGYLYGGLTVRRNLRYEEYKKLQDTISQLEGEIRVGNNLEILIPKLLNTYFWVFDYYVYQMKTLGGASQINKRVLELLAMLYQVPGYEEAAGKIGLCAEKVLDILVKTAQTQSL